MNDERRRLADLVVAATDGEISLDDALAAEVPFSALGMTSLGIMRLIDAIEDDFGIELDLTSEVPAALTQTVDSIAVYLAEVSAAGR